MNFLKRWICNVQRWIYTSIAKRTVKSYGTGLRVNGSSKLGRNTTIGKYCNFNGMIIAGEGNVCIGNYFHSGVECMIITQNHNYEGAMIPYDNTYIYKKVTIGDCVWFGNRVIVTGNVTIGEGVIVAAGAVVRAGGKERRVQVIALAREHLPGIKARGARDEMPLTHNTGLIPGFLQHLGIGGLIAVECRSAVIVQEAIIV